MLSMSEHANAADCKFDSLVHLLETRAADQPEQLAYTFLRDGEVEEAHLSYGELARKARAVGAWLQERKLQNRNVLLLYPPGLEYIVAFWGCLYAGAVAVPAYPPSRNRHFDRLQTIATDAQAQIALTTSAIRERIQSPALSKITWGVTEELDEQLAGSWRAPQVNHSTLAFLQYTSGSTATPKGVMVTHGGLLHNEELIRHAFHQSEHSVIVGWLPLYHDMGLIGNVLQPLYLGARCILMSPLAFLQQPSRWLRAISRYRGTTSGGPNFAYDLCSQKISEAERDALDLSCWTVAFNGAEPVRAETLQRFVDFFEPCGFKREAFYPCYGLAEATLFVSGARVKAQPTIKTIQRTALERGFAVAGQEPVEHDLVSLVGCGASQREPQIVVANPESLASCAPGEVGEIWISGPSVAAGYWNRPEETANVFEAYLSDSGAGPYLRSGDLGFLQSDELFVTGRIKDLIIIRGRNLYPHDLERTVEKSHPSLRAGGGAAFSIDHGGEERLVIVHEIGRHVSSSYDAVIGNIRQSLAEEHEVQPQSVALVATGAVPKTSSGKTQRSACREMFLSSTLPVVAAWNASGDDQASEAVLNVETEEELAGYLRAQLASRLGVDTASIDVREPITRYGLDSLAAIEIAHAIESDFGVQWPMAMLLEGPSLLELATQLGARIKGTAASRPVAASRAKSNTYALSHGQQALWFLHRLNPKSAAYNVAAAARIQGELDTEVLKQAFAGLAQRHDVLRTTFDVAEGTPTQRIHADLSLHFTETDASSSDQAEFDEWLAKEASRPFDLSSGRLPWRVNLFKRPSDEYVLLIVAHHVIVDFWSLAVIWQEVGELYTAQRQARPATLPPLQTNYTDYVGHQSEMLAGPEGEHLWNYWQKQLGENLPVLNLPSDRPRSLVQSNRGAAYTFKLDPSLTGRLNALAHDHGATLYATLLAAFETLLYRYTGQESFAVGSPSSGRDSAALADMVGYFVNPLVMRADFSGDLSFVELLARVRRTALDALAHQAFPFALLVQRLQPERDPSRTPLFETMFVYQPSQLLKGDALASFAGGEAGLRVKAGELLLESLALPQRTALFDLMVSATEVGETLLGSIEYSTDLFDEASIRRMAGHFQTILESIVENPQQRVSKLELVTPDEKHQLIVDWNAARIDYPREQCMHELFEAQVARSPQATALVYQNERLSYAELNERANHVAHYLRTLGVGPETLVGILLERTPVMLVGMLGVLKAGGAYVPLDINYPRERLQFMLEDSDVKVVLTQSGLHSTLPQTQAEVLVIDERGQATLPDLFIPQSNQATEPRTSQEEGLAPAVEDLRVCANNLAYVIYTSGSTGRPKGVAIEHRSAVAFIHWAQEQFSAEQLAGVFASTSICFDLSVFEIFVPLSTGGKIILAANALELPSVAAAREVTLINTVPSAMTELVRLKGVPASVRVVNLAGEPLQNALVQSVYEYEHVEQVLNLYGPSEDTTYSTWTRIEKGSEEAPTIGHPVANTQAYLLDAHLQLVPVGAAGELYLGGFGLARGYLNRPELTAERFVPDPFSGVPGARLYRTGDLARYQQDGRLEYLGRLDHQLKLRGFRIELGEIETVLRENSAVRDAVVVAHETATGDKQLVAYVVANGSLATEALRAHLKQKLPHYMIPAAFVALDKLPLSPNGKIDRQALPAPGALTQDVETDFVAPRNQIEEIIAGIWASVLGLEQAGVHNNFFHLGGHSLLATQVIARINETFQVDLPLSYLFESPTVAVLAERVTAATQESGMHHAPPIVKVERDAPLPLSFAQQRLWFLHQLEPGSAAYHVPILIRLTGSLEVRTLEQSIREIIDRHESLRTTFKNVNERAVQVIAPTGSWRRSWRLGAIDLSASEEAEAEALRLAQKAAVLPFDLSNGPLFRATLWRLDVDAHILLLSMHHIVADGWSIGVFVSELSALYNAFAGGRPSPLAELPCQYVDFAQWQRQQLSGDALAAHLAYWKQRLSGPLPPIELPGRRVLSTNQVSAATEQMPLPEHLYTALQRLTRQRGVTTFMTLLATFQTLLHRYTGLDDIVVGTPVANRTRIETESLVGFFANTLVLRGDVSGDPSFDELLARVRTLTLEAHAHQDVPFELLVEELQPERDLNRTPLFQIMLVMQNTPPAVMDLPGVRVEQLELESTAPKFDLVLFLKESDGSLTASWEYNPARFDAETIKGLASHFETLLESAIADPDQRISRLKMLADDERHSIVTGLNETAVEYPRASGLHKLFEAQMARTPGATALVHNNERLSYEELNARANQLAHYLRGLGAGSETLVGICLERSLEMVIGLLGILKAGAAYVPLDPSYPQERQSLMIEEAGIRVVLTTQRFREMLSVDAISLDADWNLIALESKANPATNTVPGNVAYVIYTSGSTGKPKGSMITHEGICNRLLWMQEAYQLTTADRVLQKTPYTFDVSVWEFFWPLITGARLVMARPGGQGDSRYLVDVIKQQEITTLHFVPSMLAVFLDERGARDCRSLKRVICSGEALPYELKEKFVKLLPAELHNLYGPTEASVDVTYWDCRSAIEPPVVPIGRPIANTQIYVLDKNLQAVPLGVSGELYIGGIGLARGYLKRADLTAERFLPDPFGVDAARIYRTGDLARYLADGNIEYLGRTDHQVKLRGFRIELGEIESALHEHPAVQQAVVVAREESSGDKRLVAYVVPDPQRAAPINRLLGLEAAGQLKDLVQFELPNEMTIVCRNRNETEFMYEEIFADKTYLNFGIDIPDDACIFDVGANIGLFTLFASRLAPRAQVYAFEPIAPVFEILRRNTEIHGVNAKLFECGLSNVSEQSSFTYYPNVSLMSGRFADVVADGETVKSFVMGQQHGNGSPSAGQLDELIAERLTSERLTCQLKTLSEVIRDEGVQKIDLLKIDVEKGELEVLAGIDAADWPKIQQIVMEVHDLDGRVRQVTELLSRHGFEVNVQQDAMLKQTNLYNLYASRNRKTVSHRIDKPAEVVWSSRKLLVQDLRERLKERLPEYMVPADFVLLAELPATSSGKVDRRALPDPAEVALEPAAAYVEPRTRVELQLAQIWQELLNRKHVSVHDNFFELGGHSLLAMQVISRVSETFEIDIPLRSIFEAKTIAELAERIERSKGTVTMSPIPRASRDNALPLSFAQQRLWFLDQVAPGNPAYNIQAAVRLSGPLNVAAFASTLNEIVQRHEILRTTFHIVDGQPTQVISPVAELSLTNPSTDYTDNLRNLWMDFASEEARKPFDLTQRPLLRATLLRLAETEHVLLLSVHHIVADGWSMGVLVEEVATLYPAFVEAKPSPLAELPIQYADFAAWQRQWLQGEVLHEQLDYWHQQLAGLKPLELPTDHPRPPAQSFRGARRFFSFPAEISNELRALSQREGVTLYMTLLAAWQTLLHRYTGQNEIVVGTDIANRNRRELESLIGFFTNQLVLRADFSGNPTFKELLRRVREVTLGAYAHQDLPFEKLVEVLQLERTLDRNPLFQVMFVFQNTPMRDLELPGLSLRPLEVDEGTTAFDLTLTMEETAEGIKGSMRYSTDLFNATTIERMMKHFQNIVRSIVASVEIPVQALQMYDAEVSKKERTTSRLKKLTSVKPRALNVSGDALFQTSYLTQDQQLPLVIQSSFTEVDLATWAKRHEEMIEAELLRHGALLFRGFNVNSLHVFEEFTRAVSHELLEYGERSSPRTRISAGIYTSTDHPADQQIVLHNEQSYTLNWPMKIWFCCQQPAQQGGRTPIAGSREIYRRLDPALIRLFEQKSVMYVRNYGDGLGLPWQEVFQTRVRAEVEEHCRRAAIVCEWKDGDRLCTRQLRPAVRTHPKTGEWVWFNHALFFHVSSLDAKTQAAFAGLTADELPFNTLFGDGTPIDPSLMEEIREAYREATVSFPWQAGDVLMLDNMLVAHGREPFVGPRKVVVAMGDPFREIYQPSEMHAAAQA
jgi:amino acid adenylation domain-containing protein/FkbM family methyltransferase